MRILAVDPGRTTGLALAIDGELEWQTQDVGYHSLDILLDRTVPDVLVVERFLYQRREKVDLTPVEMIGICKLYAEINGKLVEYHEQTPAQAKKFWTDKKLREAGVWIPSSPHAMDATRHLLYYLSFTLKDPRWIERLRND